VVLGSTSLKDLSNIDEISGNMYSDEEMRGLMHTVLESDKNAIEDGKLITDAINQGFLSFTPSEMFEALVKNYSFAEHIYGKSFISRLFEYDPSYLKRNINIPEFQKLLKEKLKKKMGSLKDEGLLGEEYELTEKGISLASVIMYFEELDHLVPKGFFGEKEHREKHSDGAKDSVKPYSGERYRNIAMKASVKKAIRRGHTTLIKDDLMSFEMKARGHAFIVYALDASGSMRGKKLEQCKKAGIALAYRAIEGRDKVGLIVFGKNVKSTVEVTDNFPILLKEIVKIRAGSETNLVDTIKEAIKLFPSGEFTKHLVIVTDAMPTVGDKPQHETLEAVNMAAAQGLTISVVGIELNPEGKSLAEKMVLEGKGRLYLARDLAEIDKLVLEDYYEMAGNNY
jgi:Mg-chelatase subunit ChlD